MSIVNDAVGIIFMIGLTLIYIPQFLKLYRKKTSHGFNPWFMFLGHTAAFWTCCNTLVYYINSWWSCHGTTNCSESFLGFALVLLQWLLYFVMYLFYLKYLSDPQKPYYASRPNLTRQRLIHYTFGASVLLCVLSLTVTLTLLSTHQWHDPTTTTNLSIWTDGLEVLILIFFLIHYFPQIYETYTLQDAGSLSLITLGLMAPGTFLWTIFLAVQGSFVKNNQQVSSPLVWVPYLIVGTMQTILLMMGLYYERKKRRNLYLLLDQNPETGEDSSFFPAGENVLPASQNDSHVVDWK